MAFGFANPVQPRLNGQQALSQQMGGLQQSLMAPQTTAPSAQASVNLPQAWNQVTAAANKLGFGNAQPTYNPGAMNVPQVGMTPANGAYDPAALTMNGQTPVMADAGAAGGDLSSMFSSIASLFGA